MKRRDFLASSSCATSAACVWVASGSLQKSETIAHNRSDVGSVVGSAVDRVPPFSGSTELLGNVLDPSYVDARLDSRSVGFENPTGARGAGGKIANGRKGRPMYVLAAGEKVILADLVGPGTLRHMWTMLCGMLPETGRALRLEVFYDGLLEPSISVPILDFFGLPHGRVVEYYSALVSVHEGRGLNSFVPMPFGRSVRMELTNESAQQVMLYYQIDYTLEPVLPASRNYLHATFRRENPTTLRRDFVITEGLKGPGRFLGCAVGVRIIDDGPWYGEGEVKIYRDGDRDYPTYCGTGLEDYVGSAYGLGRHCGYYSGAPIHIPPREPNADPYFPPNPKFASFYRWHLPDPIMFSDELRVTIQQIGLSPFFDQGQEAELEAYKRTHTAAASGEWSPPGGFSLVERRDDYCATAYVYCRSPQPVIRYKTDAAMRDIGLLQSEEFVKRNI